MTKDLTKVTVNVDKKCYSIIKEKLPALTETMEDFAQSAVIEKTERLLSLTNKDSKMEYETVTIRIPKPFFKGLLSYLNTHPYYEDFNEYVIEALRNHNLDMRSDNPIDHITA